MGSPGGAGGGPGGVGGTPGGTTGNNAGGGGGGPGGVGASPGANAGANAAGAAAAAAGAQAAAGAKAAASQSKSTSAVGNMGAAKSAGAAAAAAQGAAAQAAKASAVGLGGAGAKAGTQGPNAAAGAAAAHAASAAAAGGLAKAAAAANAGSKTTGFGGPFGGLGKAGIGAPNAAGAAAATNAAAKANAAGLSGPSKSTGTPGGISGGAMAAREAASKAGGLAQAAAKTGGSYASRDPGVAGVPGGITGRQGLGDAYGLDAKTAASIQGQGTALSKNRDAVGAILGEAKVQGGISPTGALGIAGYESGVNPRAVNHSYKGLGQMNPGSWGEGMRQAQAQMKAGGLLGWQGKTPGFADNWSNPTTAARAAVGYMNQQAAGLFKNLGQAPTTGQVYGAHQQGLTGYSNLVNADPHTLAKDVVGFQKVSQNIHDKSVDPHTITANDFARYVGGAPATAAARVGISGFDPHTAFNQFAASQPRAPAATPTAHIQDRPQAMQRYGAETTSMPSLGTAPPGGSFSNQAMAAANQPSKGIGPLGAGSFANAAMQAGNQPRGAPVGAGSFANTAMQAGNQPAGAPVGAGSFPNAAMQAGNQPPGMAVGAGSFPSRAMDAANQPPAGTSQALAGILGANPGTLGQMNAPSAPATGLKSNVMSGASFPGGAPGPANAMPGAPPAGPASTAMPTSYAQAVKDAQTFLSVSHPPNPKVGTTPYKDALDDALTFLKGINTFAPNTSAPPPGGSFPASAMTAANQPSAPPPGGSFPAAAMTAANQPSAPPPGGSFPAAAMQAANQPSAPSPPPGGSFPAAAMAAANQPSAPPAGGSFPGAAMTAANQPPAAQAAETAIPEAQPTPFNPEQDKPVPIRPGDIAAQFAKYGAEYSSWKAGFAKMANPDVASIGPSPTGGWAVTMKDGATFTSNPKTGTFSITRDGNTITGNLAGKGRVGTSFAGGLNDPSEAVSHLFDKPSTPSPAAPAAPAAPPGNTMTGIPGFGPKGNFNYGFGNLGGWSAPQMGQPGQQPGMPGMPQMGQPQGPSMAPPGAMPPGMMGPSHFGPPSRPGLSPQAAPPSIGNPMMGGGQMGANTGGSGSPPPPQQPPMGLLSPMMSASAAPAPTTPPVDPTAPGRIPVSSGGATGSLADLFAQADKAASSSGSGKGGQSTIGDNHPSDWIQSPTNPNVWVPPGAYYNYRTLDYKPDAAALPEGWKVTGGNGSFTISRPYDTAKDGGITGGSSPGTAAASTASQKEAEAFLKSLGLGGASSSSPTSGNKSSAASTPSLIKTSAATATTTDPNRIPVSTGTASGSITTKPSGVSGSDWKKYQSLSAKLANSKTISSKNQQWYDAFTAKNGGATGGGTSGGGTSGGGGTPPIPSGPLSIAPDVGLLTRPYDNPFERRNLWNLFPPVSGGG